MNKTQVQNTPPRVYAFGKNGSGGIIRIGSKSERKKALAQVPEKYQGIVKDHVTTYFDLRKHARDNL